MSFKTSREGVILVDCPIYSSDLSRELRKVLGYSTTTKHGTREYVTRELTWVVHC